MEPDVTICTVSYNALYAGALMWESYCKYNQPCLLYVFDNNSTDGMKEYFEDKADYLFSSSENVGHGRGLDHLCRLVKTPYTLIVDTDIEFFGDFVSLAKRQNAFSVSQVPPHGTDHRKFDGTSRHHNNFKKVMKRQWGWNLYCTLFKTEELQLLAELFSFDTYYDTGHSHFYDTGSMLYHVAKAKGLNVCEMDVSDLVKHYWSVSLGNFLTKNAKRKATKKRLYDVIKTRLGVLRESRRLKLL